jgi:Zn-dependent protease with chaperone function
MNFFAQQERARTNTAWLVGCLIAAVAGLVAVTTIAIAAFIYILQNSNTQGASQAFNQDVGNQLGALLTAELAGSVTAIVLIVVVSASLFKLLQLSRGGSEVAEALGGRLISPDTRDRDERKVLNVVEEMAIASGNPVPRVYLLEDQAINAFAAGFNRNDAVIGVTRGCIQQLNRDELQGVIAHEFSHIHFGDMRLNMRLVALLHGILIIGLIGYFVLRSAGLARRKAAGAQLALGLALIIIGYVGTFFGNVIKAAVSRQREFLADASAVQFTRNPSGIAGALKKIGGWQHGTKLQDRHAAEYSHLFFGTGVNQLLGSALATHPPLDERIKRIEPQWDGQLGAPQPSQATVDNQELRGQFRARTSDSALVSGLTQVDHQVGNPSPEHITYARDLLHGLPHELVDAAHEPYSARAVIYALLLDSSKGQRESQMAHLRANAHPATFKVIASIEKLVRQLPRTQYLPLLELSIPALKQLSSPQYQVFKQNMAALIRADKQVSLFEWTLYRSVTQSVEEKRPRHRTHLQNQQHNANILLSVVCYSGKNAQPTKAYAAGAKALGLPPKYELLSPADIDFSRLDAALEGLAGIAPLEKPRLLKALVACINADGAITAEEAELFRAVADSLDCPVPPVLPTQSKQ